MKKVPILAFAGAMLVLSLPVMAKPPVFAPASPIAFSCSLTGGEKLRPQLDSAAVCALFKRRIEAEIARTTRQTLSAPARGQSIKIAVRIVGSREATATTSIRARGRNTNLPEISLDVMDKTIGMRDLETLASQVSRTISQL